jgi:voltage-gated potassium channel
VFVIAGEIATLTTLFARLAAAIDSATGRRMTGTATISATGHTVIVGYVAGRIERIISEILTDSSRELVLCAAADVASHPVPHLDVAFTKGNLQEPATKASA